jgi:hypothetical protein
LSSKPFPVNAEKECSAERNPPVPAERGLSKTAARRQTELLGNYRRCERYSTRCKLGLRPRKFEQSSGQVTLNRIEVTIRAHFWDWKLGPAKAHYL